jgi:hypothetical protein
MTTPAEADRQFCRIPGCGRYLGVAGGEDEGICWRCREEIDALERRDRTLEEERKRGGKKRGDQ